MIKKDKKQTPAMVLLFTPHSKHALWTAPCQHASPGEGPVPRPVLPRQPVHLGGGGHLAPAPAPAPAPAAAAAAQPRHHEGGPAPGRLHTPAPAPAAVGNNSIYLLFRLTIFSF